MSKATTDGKTIRKTIVGKPPAQTNGRNNKTDKSAKGNPSARQTNSGKARNSKQQDQNNDFISVADENEINDMKSTRSKSSLLNGHQNEEETPTEDELARAREQMNELEKNAKHSDDDFLAQYEEFKENNSESLEMISNAWASLDKQADTLEDSSIVELFSDSERVESIRKEVSTTGKLLLGAEKYLSNDFMDELLHLRTSLKRCVEVLSRKLREVNVIPGNPDKNFRAVTISAEALRQLAAVSVELKELENKVLMIIQTSQRLVDELAKDSADIRELENLIEQGQQQLQKDKETESAEQTNGDDDENNSKEQEDDLNQDNIEHIDEEELRRLREEDDARERERLSKEEEDQERLRREKEREEKLKLADPKNWPTLIYNLDGETDYIGSGLACILRVNPSIFLAKNDLHVTSLDMLTNRYQPGDNEELVSNVINIRPANTQDKQLEIPIWIAVPCISVGRGREFSIRVQQVQQPRVRPQKRLNCESDDRQNTEQIEHKTSDDGNTYTSAVLDEQIEQHGKETETEGNDETGGKEYGADDQNDSIVEERKSIKLDDQREPRVRKESRVSVKQELDVKQNEEEEDEDKIVEEALWEDVITRETTVEGHESIRFVETTFKEISAYGLNILVITRPKKETSKFNNKGGKLIYSMDTRNSISIPKNAFRLEVEVTMQVITVDSAVMNGLMERYDGCDTLIGSSPFINISLSNKPSKPLLYTVANPSGGNKTRKSNVGKVGVGVKRASLPSLTKSKIIEDSMAGTSDNVTVMIKDTKGKWKHCESVELTVTKEFTSFQLSDHFERLILLRTTSLLDSLDLCKLSANLESSLLERSVNVIVRQSVSDPEDLVLELVRSEMVDKISERLQQEDYTDGPETDEQICLREGDLIEISFRDNLKFEEGKTRRIVFNSNLQSGKLKSRISIVNTFAQNALENYRGCVQLNLVGKDYQAPPKLSARRKKPKNAQSTFICETPITLPKPFKEVSRINRVEVRIETEGPISEEYFDQLSNDLGEEWLQVASKLGHSISSLQRIQQTYAYLAGTAEGNRRCIKAMLVDWFKVSKKSKYKVTELYNALLEGRRNDLAEALLEKDKQLREESVRQEKEALLEKCSRAYSESPAARKTWRPVARALGLTSEDIVNICEAPQQVEEITVEQAREMLVRWQNIRGSGATKDSLVVVLRKLKLTEAANNISMVR